ncbi:MAG: HAD family hydrolase [Terriglobia bacterium]
MAYKIRAVIFDYGNVLCPMPSPLAFEEMAGLAEIPSPAFLVSLWRHRLDYDRDTLDSPAYWREIARDNGKRFTDVQIQKLIETDLALWIHPNPSMLAWVRALRKSGMKTAILSNMPREFSRYLRSNADWLNDFDHKVFSGEMGVVKPDARIYHACIDGLDVAPQETLFIDDVAANVSAAEALGINAIRFESIAQLCFDVQQFGLSAPLVDLTGATPFHAIT